MAITTTKEPIADRTLSSNIQDITCNQFADGSITVTPVGGVAPYTYLWNNGEITNSVNGLDVGAYDVIMTDSTGCFTTQSFYMNDPYTISFGGIVPPICPGGSNGKAVLNSSGCPCMFSGCIFDWESGASIKTATNLVEGWNQVIITHPDGCIVTDSVLVPDSDPVMDSLTFSNIMCATDPFASSFIELHLHDSLNTIVNWTTGETIPYIDSLNTGFYYFDLLDSRGCGFNDSVFITAADTLLSNNLVIDLTCFEDGSGSITASAYGGFSPYTYTWSNATAGPVNNGLPAGTHGLTVTDSVGCECTTNEILVNEPLPLVVNITNYWNDTTGTCTGVGAIQVSGGTPTYNYLWNDLLVTVNDTVTGLCEGVYTITVTDMNGCQTMDSISIFNVVGLDDLNEEQQLLIYPNPISNTISLQVSENLFGLNFSIYDMHGKKVSLGSIGAVEMKIDVSSLKTGLYYFSIDERQNSTVKIIKL